MLKSKLILGNCGKKLQKLDPNSIDLIATDPPYGLDIMGADWSFEKIEKQKKFANVVGGPAGMKFNPDDSKKLQAFLFPVFKEYLKLLKPGGFCLVFSQSRSSHRVGVALEDAGFELRDQLFWDYGMGQQKAQGMQNFIKKSKKINPKHKNAILKSLEGKKTPQLAPCVETIWLAQKPKEGTFVENWIKWKKGLVNFNGDTVKVKFEHRKPRGQERIDSGGHPTLKPISLMEDLICRFSNEHDVVLDSFMGSGTTGVAAKNTNRNFIGIEMDKKFYNISKKRLKN